MRVAWLALAIVALPTAAALDAFPTESRLGPTEATFLVRLPEGGELRVVADGPVEVRVGEGPFVPAPATFPVNTSAVWHGLPGTVALTARRADATRAISLEADDGAGGIALEWPAQAPPRTRGVPLPGAFALVGIAGVALALRRAPR